MHKKIRPDVFSKFQKQRQLIKPFCRRHYTKTFITTWIFLTQFKKKRRRKKSDWYSFSSNTHKLLSSWIIFTLMTSNAREKTLVCTCANKSSSCVSDLASSFYVRSSRVISWLFSTNDLKCVLSLILMSVIWLNRS